jgi:hypothetical protein
MSGSEVGSQLNKWTISIDVHSKPSPWWYSLEGELNRSSQAGSEEALCISWKLSTSPEATRMEGKVVKLVLCKERTWIELQGILERKTRSRRAKKAPLAHLLIEREWRRWGWNCGGRENWTLWCDDWKTRTPNLKSYQYFTCAAT